MLANMTYQGKRGTYQSTNKWTGKHIINLNNRSAQGKTLHINQPEEGGVIQGQETVGGSTDSENRVHIRVRSR